VPGTFLFVACEEVIPKEMASGPKGVKLLLLCLGFAMMALIKLMDVS
jgi:hypothetical protein